MSSVTLPTAGSASPKLQPKLQIALHQQNESYVQLVWRRFRKSKPAIVGGLMVLILAMFAIFAEFFSPNPLDEVIMQNAFIPPQRVHIMDAEGNFHWQPFIYDWKLELDPKTFTPLWTENTDKIYPVHLFVKSWEYKLFGLFPTRLHLF